MLALLRAARIAPGAGTLDTTHNAILRGMLIGLLGVFILLSFQFRSYLEPLIVMTTIPLALIGVVAGHLVMGINLSMPSLLGFVSLTGIVVNNAILLILYLKMRREQGAEVVEAAAQASRHRFRAIIITSTTTIAGLLPLLTERSLQAQVLIPMATSIAFGLSLHAHSVEKGVDLIVLTTHGRGPLSRFWLGSVAIELVRQVPMPVLLVRPQEGEPDLASEPILRRILIPLDGSDFAEQIIKPAKTLGQLMQSDYRLLRVVPSVMFAGFAQSRGTSLGLSEMLATEARSYLKRVGKRLQEQSLAVQMQLITDLQPAEAILRDAQTHNMDLIALATHGRGGVAGLVLGSIADKVLRPPPLPSCCSAPSASEQRLKDGSSRNRPDAKASFVVQVFIASQRRTWTVFVATAP